MLPYFYHAAISPQQEQITLDEATSKHCIQVLRMQEKSQLVLTNGMGLKIKAEILVPERKKVVVTLLEETQETPRSCRLAVAIAFTKNKSRNEWFLEKATELGIEQIYPILTERSEKEKFNLERYKQILISAMLQSQQCFLPHIHEPLKFSKFLQLDIWDDAQKLIAHCVPSEEKKSMLQILEQKKSCVALIGPEGDFSEEEVSKSFRFGFLPVSLGTNRLRTETAGIYVTTVFNAFHDE